MTATLDSPSQRGKDKDDPFRLMRFGHRVYKNYDPRDPRATLLVELYKQLTDKIGTDIDFRIAHQIEKLSESTLGKKGICPNVDFYSGIVYRKLGIPTDLFTPIFAIARVSGWLAHWKEQLGQGRIYRPSQIFNGKFDVPYTPIDKR